MKRTLIIVGLLILLMPVGCVVFNYLNLTQSITDRSNAEFTNVLGSGVERDWHTFMTAFLNQDYLEARAYLNYYQATYPEQTLYNAEAYQAKLDSAMERYVRDRTDQLIQSGGKTTKVISLPE